MAVAIKLNKRFYDTLSQEVTNELVDALNGVDSSYRAEFRDLFSTCTLVAADVSRDHPVAIEWAAELGVPLVYRTVRERSLHVREWAEASASTQFAPVSRRATVGHGTWRRDHRRRSQVHL